MRLSTQPAAERHMIGRICYNSPWYFRSIDLGR